MKIITAYLIGGGPFDGMSSIIHEDLDEIQFPYTKEMLQSREDADNDGNHQAWMSVEPPSKDEADGIAIYRRHEPVPKRDPDGGTWIGVPQMLYKFDRFE